MLAPMVRAGFTSMRSICLEYGASCVFTDVVIASNIVQSNIYECEDSVLFIRNNNRVLRLMKHDMQKTIVQLAGTNVEVFLQATEKLSKYCAGIDINCGCTKDWTHSCMGAGLLQDKQKLISLATQLAETCQKHEITSSVKIRLLSTQQETIQLLDQLFKAGLTFVTVHMRTQQEDREVNQAHWDEFAAIFQQMENKNIVANGDIFDLAAANQFLSVFEGEKPALMVARGAVRKPSVFQALNGQEADSTFEVIEKLYMKSNTENYEWKLVKEEQQLKQVTIDYLNQYKFNEFKTLVMFMLQEQKKRPADLDVKQVKELIVSVANLKTFQEFFEQIIVKYCQK
uniref:tRNA-dihydrouridine synthase n=1 Tax=Trepomonas sp. PC1 TaxID=1076344 RepID=A0A146KBL6_9EUKA|eukprot:JAP92871.1 Dihydrouridine synthase-like (DUS-like) FMN-binding domain-containing protein [Trepomonas sp. PC1]